MKEIEGIVKQNLEKYIELLLQWNEEINLIGKSTVETIWNRHIVDSLQLLDCIDRNEIENATIADFGSGAGIPGIILSIAGVKSMTLIEKSIRKGEFLNEAKKISPNKIELINENIFDLKNIKFDIIISRALAPLIDLLDMTTNFMHRDTKCVFLKGKKLPFELLEAQKYYQFDFEIKKSITSDESGIILIKNIKLLGK